MNLTNLSTLLVVVALVLCILAAIPRLGLPLWIAVFVLLVALLIR